jgi:hypothetical protein
MEEAVLGLLNIDLDPALSSAMPIHTLTLDGHKSRRDLLHQPGPVELIANWNRNKAYFNEGFLPAGLDGIIRSLTLEY